MPSVDAESDARAIVGDGIVAARNVVPGVMVRYVMRTIGFVMIDMPTVIDIPAVIVVVGSRSIRVVTMMVTTAGSVTMIGSSSRGERDTQSQNDSETQQ